MRPLYNLRKFDMSRNEDSVKLSQAIEAYMNSHGYQNVKDSIPYFSSEPMAFKGDGSWSKNLIYYFMEQKTHSESHSGWWVNKTNNLSGHRSLIARRLGINPIGRSDTVRKRQNKWMTIIAQLRNDILKLDRTQFNYAATFSIPIDEEDSFRECFKKYNADPILNPFSYWMKHDLIKWPSPINWNDKNNISATNIILEIGTLNYFL